MTILQRPHPRLWLPLAAFFMISCNSDRDAVTEAHEHDAAPEAAEEAATQEFVCPMHPQIRQPHFGTCPICHMDLVPVSGGTEDSVIDIAQFSDASLALLDIQTEKVARQRPTRNTRAFGALVSARDQETTISARASGRIERLSLPEEGRRVGRGATIARIFSPELAATASLIVSADPDNTIESTLAEGARQELRNLGLSHRDIDRLRSSSSDGVYIPLRAAHGGVVQKRFVREGDYVQQGDPIVSLVGTDAPWVELEVEEARWSSTKVGQHVTLQLMDGRELESELIFVSPLIDPARRRFVARALWPEDAPEQPIGARLHATIEQQAPENTRTVYVPESAVLHTGERSLVYVVDRSSSPPVYQPVEVRVGERWGEHRAILEGLFHGEEIVSEGAFRIDATLFLRSGAGMLRQAAPEHLAPPTDGGGHEHH